MSRDKLSHQFEEYAAYHRHPKNKLCHYVGIPLIVFTLVGLLSRVPLVSVVGLGLDLAWPVAAAALVYQLRLSVKWTAAFAGFVLLCYLTSPGVPASVLWAGFVLGWILQLVGHYVYEKRSPAFFKNLEQLLVGPLWILGTLVETPPSRREAPGSAPLEE